MHKVPASTTTPTRKATMNQQQEARVTTLTATVKQLEVSGRQVTSTLAKQLDVEEVPDVDRRKIRNQFEGGFLTDKNAMRDYLYQEPGYPYFDPDKYLIESHLAYTKSSIDYYSPYNWGWDEKYLETLTYNQFKNLPDNREVFELAMDRWRSEMSDWIVWENAAQGGNEALLKLRDAATSARKSDIEEYEVSVICNIKDSVMEKIEPFGRIRVTYPKARDYLNQFQQFIGVRKVDGQLVVIIDTSHTTNGDGTTFTLVPEWYEMDNIVLGGIG